MLLDEGGPPQDAISVNSDSTGYSSAEEEETMPGGQVTNPMVVVSNRLPFVLMRKEDGSLERRMSAGGLVTAVAPVVVESQGTWVGWTGLHDFCPSVEEIPECTSRSLSRPTDGLKSDRIVPIAIKSRTVFEDYYNGCCNATFWPLFHSMPDRAVFNRETWLAYETVNKEFGLRTLEAVRRVAQTGTTQRRKGTVPLVWLHDYHLMLAANTIRDACVEEELSVRMGFFLHIPFPSWDIMRIFPWGDEILQGMLGCDLVAFHIEDYCLNFLECCSRSLGCRVDRSRMLVEHCGRTVQVKALPIGIPYDRFASLARTSPRAWAATGHPRVVLGVDRLDYTKGLVSRLKSFRRLLEKYPKWIEKVILLQVAVPSRTEVKEYHELKEEIDKLVGCINGLFSTPSWSPIRYIYGSVGQEQLAAFYRDASVGLITPLRDGMNLVAKEFVACQDENDPGVLILSPFAGAGGLMQEALQVNPYEVENVADTLHRALEMPLDQRQMRMFQLKKREKRMDVGAWVQGFLGAMGAIYTDQQDEQPRTEEAISKIGQGDFDRNLGPLVDHCSRLGVILDFDGTLSPLARKPELAIIPSETKRVLERLSAFSDCKITVISGRSIEELQRKVGVDRITYAGNHGLEILHPDGTRFNHPMPAGYKEKLAGLERELRERCQYPGAWVEPKGLLVALHYREVAKEEREELIEMVSEIYRKHDFEFMHVSKRIENVPPVGWDRGRSSIHILRSLFGVDWEEMVQVIYAGDSAADELAMEVLRGVAYSFKVINEDTSALTKTWANARLEGPDAVQTMLKYLERKLGGRRISVGTVKRSSLMDLLDAGLVIEEQVSADDLPRPRSASFNIGRNKRRTYSHSLSSPSHLPKVIQ